MTRSNAFPADPSRARRALDTYQSLNGSGEPPMQECIAHLLADLALLAREKGINYGALIAHAQASWLNTTVNASPRPPPKSESSLRSERSSA
jgi:hypothetical protein